MFSFNLTVHDDQSSDASISRMIGSCDAFSGWGNSSYIRIRWKDPPTKNRQCPCLRFSCVCWPVSGMQPPLLPRNIVLLCPEPHEAPSCTADASSEAFVFRPRPLPKL